MAELKEVTSEYYRFLYDLLKEKTPEQNISHKIMPTWEEHVRFNESQPYKYDFVIYDGEPIGRIYLSKQNEIGIHIKNGFLRKGYGGKILKEFMDKLGEKVYYANISPLNVDSQQFFIKNGFHLIQYTYKYEN